MCCDAKLTKWAYLCETFCERLCTKLKLAILGMLGGTIIEVINLKKNKNKKAKNEDEIKNQKFEEYSQEDENKKV